MELKNTASQMQNWPAMQQGQMDSYSVMTQAGECQVVIFFFSQHWPFYF